MIITPRFGYVLGKGMTMHALVGRYWRGWVEKSWRPDEVAAMRRPGQGEYSRLRDLVLRDSITFDDLEAAFLPAEEGAP